jgi:hypothetical protein
MSRFSSMMNDYLSRLSQESAQAVQSFYQPPEPLVRDSSGIPQYGGSSFNAYQGINPYQYSGMDRDDNPADKLYADLIRAQTRDYNTRFAPLENFLASEITATGTKSLAGDMTRTREAVTGAGVNVRGQQQRAAGRYGLTSQNMGAGASEMSALVGGLNDTKMRDIDRRQGLLTGSMSGISQKARGGTGA